MQNARQKIRIKQAMSSARPHKAKATAGTGGPMSSRALETAAAAGGAAALPLAADHPALQHADTFISNILKVRRVCFA